MEYQYLEESWKECLVAGNIEEAIKRIEKQIALNLMVVHNRFCMHKMKSHDDVYAYMLYGKTDDITVTQKMKPFINFNYDFIEIGHGLEYGSSCPREIVFNNYENLEKSLQSEMSKL